MDKLKHIHTISFLEKIRSGDEDCFKTLFDHYYPRLFIIVRGYVNNRSDAEEITQDIFIKVWKKRENINTNLCGFLLTLTKNCCLDYLRSKKNKIFRSDNLIQLEALVNIKALEDPATILSIENELQKSISEGIQQLPDKCKEVFVQSRFRGLKNIEISEELNISIKTVENHMSKALKHMRLHLKEYLSIF